MKRILILAITFITFHTSLCGQTVISQTRTNGWTIPAGELTTKLYGAMQSASGFYSLDGELIDRFRERPAPEGTINPVTREFISTLSGTTGGLYAEYGLAGAFTAMLDVPVTRWHLRERYSYDSTYFLYPTPKDTIKRIDHIGNDRAQLSRLAPDYYGIGGRYGWVNGNNLIGITGMLYIPPGFKNNVTADSTGEFMKDEFFEGVLGVNLGLKVNKNWLSSSIRYAMRGGDFADEMRYYLEFGTRNVETTQIVVFAQYVQSLGSFQNASGFDPRRRRFQENYLLIGGIFEIELKKAFSINAGYDIRLSGKNTWALSSFTVGAGLRFSEL